ncbi:MAG: hypothetical protein GXY86_06595 [Firmicutes bacterium]|nr:hypothetical protein [Bacillota bacterium]
MEQLEVFVLDNSELAEFEAINKGYRNDVYIRKDGKYYQVNVYHILRLQQDFQSEIEDYGYYAIDPNLILVKEVSNKEIIQTIIFLNRQMYFDEIKPVKDEESINLKLISIMD